MNDRWELRHGNSFDLLRQMGPDSVDVCIMDPPYSARQHAGVRSAGRTLDTKFACRTRRVVDLGFEHFTPSDCLVTLRMVAPITKRSILVFCDDDLLPAWRSNAKKIGLQVIRTGVWHRIGGAPSFVGDRPAASVEYIVMLHRPGKKRWNGGGDGSVWETAEAERPCVWIQEPIVANRAGHRTDRVHTTQKPESLLLDLVGLFSDPEELVLDPFAGSGTTGVAALRRGRRFLGFERMDKYIPIAKERLEAARLDIGLSAFRAKQEKLF